MDYLSLFPGATRAKPHFMALAEALLRQVTDLQAVVGQLNGAFAPESARGAQLDALAASLGLRRADTSAGVSVSDEVFRDFIRKKLIRWSWDGRNGSVGDVTEKIQPDSGQADNMDGTVTITGAGGLPAPAKDMFPVPGGVRVT